MTIINIRGTSGSGKSTVVRRVVEHYAHRVACYEPGRKQPVANAYSHPPRFLYVPGHYETACGGCDTIKTPDQVYDLVYRAIEQGYDVLYEGIIVQDDTRRLLQLHQKHPVSVIELNTPIEECLAGVQARRDARGDTRPLNEKNTRGRAVSVHRGCEKLRALGLVIPEMSREEAYHYCLLLLKIKESE